LTIELSLPTYRNLVLERHGSALVVTLNRPERLNAITHEMHDELVDALRTGDQDDGSNVVVITGAGRGFCAGGDMSGMPGAGEPDEYWKRENSRIFQHERRLIESFLWAEKPVIAMVNGPASGLGATIALFCDIVVASDLAFFNDSHVQVGLVAGDGSSVIWPLLMGLSRAKEYLFTADRITAAEALRLGLVSHVVPADQLRSFTLDLAQRIGDQPAFAVRATKASVNRQLRRAVADAMDVAAAWQRISNDLPDHELAVKAFMERRKK
jgi:enoyl-CoA hydratase